MYDLVQGFISIQLSKIAAITCSNDNTPTSNDEITKLALEVQTLDGSARNISLK